MSKIPYFVKKIEELYGLIKQEGWLMNLLFM
jgi:hypothetical protein